MREKKVDIAVIDSGICEVGTLEGKIAVKVEFLAWDGNKTDTRYRRLAYVHGTTCAEIISRICPEVRFLDLRALQRDGTTQISKLLEALDWCVYQKVKLIHLSLGTVNYFDVKPLREHVKNLIDRDTVIVAAYHNSNIRTYPAAFSGVFGVRQDMAGILKQNQFLFQDQAGYGHENSIVAHWWGKDGNLRANSYAAPVITGYVARALHENGEADFHSVLEFLEENAVLDKKYQHNIKSVICKSENLNGKSINAIENNESVNIPVIAGSGVGYGEMRMLVNTFESEGFHTLLLQENTVVTDTDAISMQYYKGKDSSLEQILHTVDIIYKPDVIFLGFLYGKVYDVAEKQEIDMFIAFDCDVYTIIAEGLRRTVKEPGEVCGIICQYFR